MLSDEFSDCSYETVNPRVDVAAASVLFSNMLPEQSFRIVQVPIGVPHEGGDFPKLLLRPGILFLGPSMCVHHHIRKIGDSLVQLRRLVAT